VIIPKKTKAKSNKTMPIHSGAVIIHHDQEIAPANFSTNNIMNNVGEKQPILIFIMIVFLNIMV
jgi:hypothetical protein